MTEPDDDPQTTLDGFDTGDGAADRDAKIRNIADTVDTLADTVETLAECVQAIHARLPEDGDADTDGQPDATTDGDSLDSEPRGFE